MSRIIVTRTIDAPIDLVFQTVADIRRFSQALPHIVKVFVFMNRSMIKRAVGRDMDLVKGFCENDR